MGIRKKFSEAVLNAMPFCTVAQIRIVQNDDLALTHDVKGVEVRTVRYFVLLGGPNPSRCSQAIVRAAAYARSALILADPPSFPDESPLPLEGDYWSYLGEETTDIAVTNTSWRRNKKAARWWKVTVTYDNRCFLDKGFYAVDGSLITVAANLGFATARIRPQFENRTVPVTRASFQGLYKHDGTEKTDCVFSNKDRYCCRPFDPQVIAKGDVIPPINSAGVAFLPPLEKEEAEIGLTIEKPFLAVNGCRTHLLMNAVNCDEFYFAGYHRGVLIYCGLVAANTMRIVDFDWEETFFCDGTPIVILKMSVKIRSNIIFQRDAEGNYISATEFGWDDLVENKGLGQLLCRGDTDELGGTFGDSEESLYGSPGGAIHQLRDGNGQPVSEPQWLDCNGHPLKEEAAQDQDCVHGIRKDKLLYVRYRKYTKDFAFLEPFTLPNFLDTVFFPLDAPPPGYDPIAYCECTGSELPPNCTPVT